MNGRNYRIPSGLFWVNNRDSVTVVDPARAVCEKLADEKAVLWRLLQQELPRDELIRLYAAIRSVSETDALLEINQTLAGLAAAGFAEAADG